MHKILILDFGSQYTQLIARRVREMRVYSEMHPYGYPVEKIKEFAPQAIILSGSPASAVAADSPRLRPEVLQLGVPVLGICYGMQAMAQALGGSVAQAAEGEYGKIDVEVVAKSPLFSKVGTLAVWMSHRDIVTKLPPGFSCIARSGNSPIAAMADDAQRLYGVQFHPEVTHTPAGRGILANFVFGISRCKPSWTMASFVEKKSADIRAACGDGGVICALSGGVDSSVAAALVNKAVGGRLTSIFVNNGLLRKNEVENVEALFRDRFHIRLVTVDASKRFLSRLEGVSDPEEKRKIIGREFIAVFEEEASRIRGVRHLVQGTLYPDVIESVSVKGPSAVIKSHHNVGGLPEKMGLALVEPLRELFKDEVRELGRELGLPEELVSRHPFPGPGLAVRIVGEVTKEALDILREADYIITEEIRTTGWYEKM
jgi:GMP synthase (glutamine-hydrolysing)